MNAVLLPLAPAPLSGPCGERACAPATPLRAPAQALASSPRPEAGRLVDSFGRQATDLRISVTDRCNLRCSYCLPDERQEWIGRPHLLTVAEYARLAGIALDMGVTDVRITGGEPLLRPDLEEIVEAVASAFVQRGKPVRLAMTTNAIGLEKRLDALIAAGLQRINVSLDSLDNARYAQLSRRNRLDDVLRALDAAASSRLSPIKVNTVILDRRSLEEIPALIDYCLERGLQWRAIEYMPIGPLASVKEWRPQLADIMDAISAAYHIQARPTDPGAPARRWNVVGRQGGASNSPASNSLRHGPACEPLGIIGVIASESAPFCANCQRTRLSADGKIYSCLFSTRFADLSQALRTGASDADIAGIWRDAMWAKPAGHQALDSLPSTRTMSQIGG